MKWKPEPKIKSHPISLWWALMTLAAFLLGWFTAPRIHDGGYPVYLHDTALIQKLVDCQQDWRDDQVTKKLLRMKIRNLELN